MRHLVKIGLAMFLLGAVQLSAQEISEGKDYRVIRADGGGGDRVQVYEFFSYACGHCYDFQPLIESWAKNPPKGVDFSYMPAVFNERMIPLAKLFFTLEEMGLVETIHHKVYDAIHRKGVNLLTKKKIMSWAGGQDDINQGNFVKLYNSFGIDAKVKKAMQLTRSHRIPGTPYVTVNGKYITGPSMVLRSDGSGVDAVRFIATLNSLISMD